MRTGLKSMLIFVGVITFSYVAPYVAPMVVKPPVHLTQEAKAASEVVEVIILQPKEAKKIIPMKVTAYCPCKICCGQYADGVTTTGKNARLPGVAADRKLLPDGTKLKIPGIDQILIVDDTGGAMRQSAKKGIYHIDIRFPSHQQALNWGVQKLPVEILN